MQATSHMHDAAEASRVFKQATEKAMRAAGLVEEAEKAELIKDQKEIALPNLVVSIVWVHALTCSYSMLAEADSHRCLQD